MSLLKKKEINTFIIELKRYRSKLSKQVIKTIRGQAISGDLMGARKGLKKVLGDSYDRA